MSKYLPSYVSQLNYIFSLQRKFYLFLFILIILHKNSNSFPALLDVSNNTNRSFTKFWETQQPQQTSQTTEFNINAQQDEQKPSYFKILSLEWHHVETPYTVSVWILLASIAKILFHVHKQFGEAIPDSALLIVVGLVLGYALQKLHVSNELFTLKSTTFFLYLLPPIIFDAGYFMPNRQLFENWDSVLLFAFVGTIWNTLAIGFSLYLLGQLNLFSVAFSNFEILLFASLISAVDPVAVIAVFEEIHVNEFLFINVFGEALFNDGVSVVLYQMFRKFTLIGVNNLAVFDYIAGIFSFVVIALGGTLIGLFFAFFVSILTRFTSRVKILAPVFVFVVPYLAYLSAEMFGFSSILAIVACGIMMKQYVKGNMSHDANNSVKYFIKMLAQCSETVIFMFLGLSTISSIHQWDTSFVFVTIFLCLFYRTIGVIVQCSVLNRVRNKKFSLRDQFVLCYGGLRGAIAFGLVVSLPADIQAKRMFVTTCIAVIFFTVFLMGITIRPLLFLLKVEKADLDYEAMMVEKVYNKYFDYTMAGIEDIIGQRGRHFFRDSFERFNAKLIKPLLMRHVKRKAFDASDIVRAYNKITLTEAVKIAQVGRKMTKQASRPHSQSIASAYMETINGSTISRSNTMKREIDQYMASQDNMEALYTMFSRLLDRKVDELKRVQSEGSERRENNDDIKDDYMDILITKVQLNQQQPSISVINTARRTSNRSKTDNKLNVNVRNKITCYDVKKDSISNFSPLTRRMSQPDLRLSQISTTDNSDTNEETRRNTIINTLKIPKNSENEEKESKI
uniref:Sodium/hydrogen exchanger n=1 Tax=Meloidogyne enterolobii TaxID=390850 RepID=A0A6V7XBI4_MELEN|nr:unnamed protein product [Meloidogyne enterolobii]